MDDATFEISIAVQFSNTDPNGKMLRVESLAIMVSEAASQGVRRRSGEILSPHLRVYEVKGVFQSRTTGPRWRFRNKQNAEEQMPPNTTCDV